MTFLNASLLLGLLAAAIPVVVHLMSRREPRRIVFPATRFVKQRMESSRSRLRIRRWWLLALRILALMALAIALARPTIATSLTPDWIAAGLLAVLGVALLATAGWAGFREQQRGLARVLAAAAVLSLLAALLTAGASAARGPEIAPSEDAPAAIAIVLDNSIRSTRLAAGDGETGRRSDEPDGSRVIDRMREHARWVIGRYPSDSRIAILDRSPRPAAFSLDLAAANRQLDRSEPQALTRPLAERIEAAIRLVRSSDLSRKRVLVISDMTAASFPPSEWENASLAALLDQDPPLRLQILDVGSPPVGNLRLGLPEIADVTPARQTPTAISIRLDAEGFDAPQDEPLPAGSAPAPPTAVVEMRIHATGEAAAGLPVIRDSEIVLPPLLGADRTTVEVGPGATRVLLSVPPLDIGTHHGSIRILGGDELSIDDERFFTLQVRPAASVLLVAADRESAEWIGSALTAPRPPDDPLAEYRIEISEWLPTQRDDYRVHDAILLIDPAVPPPTAAADLRAYLDEGGKLISLLGPSLGAGASDPVNPVAAPVGESTGSSDWLDGLVRRWRPAAPGSFFEIDRPNHPAVASLADIAGGVPWSAFRISQYWQLRPSPPRDTVVIRYAGSDHPALIDRGGNHLLLTTPMPALVGPARGWNELFTASDAWPAFLLIRQMVQSLIDRDQGSHNLLISDLPRIRLDTTDPTENDINATTVSGQERSAVGQAARPDPTAGNPAASELSLQMFPPRGAVAPLRGRDSWVTVGNVDWPGTYWIRSERSLTGFSVNLPPSQTELRRLDPVRLDDWIGPERYDLSNDRESLRRSEGSDQPTRALYGWWLLVMSGAFAIEQVIANRFYRGSHSGRAALGRGTT